MRLTLAFIVLLCTPCAEAAITGNALRDLVIAGDQAGVAQALTDAVAEDAANPDVEPTLQRELFTIFTETNPRNDSFTTRWLNAAPDDPLARTARAWYLTSLGWAQRGGDFTNRTPPAAFAAMTDLHQQAFLLFDSAATAAPNLLAASDGRLVLATTVADHDLIPAEIDRIMSLHPNRGSLMRAMTAIAPQWGGAPHQMPLLCDRFASKVRTIPGYTSEICLVDAVFYAGLAGTPIHDQALLALAGMTHPILDDARLDAALSGLGDPAARVATLQSVAATRPLTAAEALALDTATGEQSGSFGFVAYLPALAFGIDALRAKADNDPLNALAVIDFITQSQANEAENKITFDKDDATRRMQTLLRSIPHSWRGWLKLGELTAVARSPEALDLGNRAFNNAMHLSGYSSEVLRLWVSYLAMPVMELRVKSGGDGSAGLTSKELAKRDRTLNCPLVAQTRFYLYACGVEGGSDAGCRQSISQSKYVFAQIDNVVARGACQTEAFAPLDQLLQPPTPVDF